MKSKEKMRFESLTKERNELNQENLVEVLNDLEEVAQNTEFGRGMKDTIKFLKKYFDL